MTREDLLRKDPRLFTYKLLLVLFVVGPAVITAIKTPHQFVREYIDTMLFAFSWPLLVLAGLYFFRRRFLVRLIERGKEVQGVVRALRGARSGKMSSSQWRTAQVAVRLDGEEKVIAVDVPRGSVAEDSRVTILVEPIRMQQGILLETLPRLSGP